MADSKISALTSYTPALDADVLPIVDTATVTTKKITWANVKATLKTYFDTLYSGVFTTSAGLAALLSDETGTGLVVFNNTPSLTTPALNGTVTGTGVSTSATASTLVQRDANVNTFSNNYFANTASTVSAGGTTVLTVASARTQNLTGASNQTFQLPDATTLALSSIFEFNNNSSGTLTINNAGGVAQYVVPAGGAVVCYCTSISTANGTWDFHALAPLAATWSSGVTGLIMNSVLTTSPRIGSGASSSTAPSFIPQRGATTTGFGGDGTDLFATIAGTAAMTISAAKTTIPGLLVTGATVSTVPYFDASKNLISSAVTPTELGYISGVTSAIQTQINTKANSSGALTQFVGNGNWKVWYSDGVGDVQELALGAAGTYLQSNGAALAPTFVTPAGTGDMVLAGVQSVTGLKTFDKDKLAMKGTSTGVTTISTANTSATSYTATLQAANGTIAYLSDISGGVIDYTTSFIFMGA